MSGGYYSIECDDCGDRFVGNPELASLQGDDGPIYVCKDCRRARKYAFEVEEGKPEVAA